MGPPDRRLIAAETDMADVAVFRAAETGAVVASAVLNEGGGAGGTGVYEGFILRFKRKSVGERRVQACR
jgi:hypothetical protein